jgi:hypothetical protein
MPRTYKTIASQHERDILNRYTKLGMNKMRSAASLGVADGFVWDTTGGIFICHRDRFWPEKDRLEYVKKMKLFPLTKVIFFEMVGGRVYTYIYKYGDVK